MGKKRKNRGVGRKGRQGRKIKREREGGKKCYAANSDRNRNRNA